jgi:hypothetical protein
MAVTRWMWRAVAAGVLVVGVVAVGSCVLIGVGLRAQNLGSI